jgi:hypothetical protein
VGTGTACVGQLLYSMAEGVPLTGESTEASGDKGWGTIASRTSALASALASQKFSKGAIGAANGIAMPFVKQRCQDWKHFPLGGLPGPRKFVSWQGGKQGNSALSWLFSFSLFGIIPFGLSNNARN